MKYVKKGNLLTTYFGLSLACCVLFLSRCYRTVLNCTFLADCVPLLSVERPNHVCCHSLLRWKSTDDGCLSSIRLPDYNSSGCHFHKPFSTQSSIPSDWMQTRSVSALLSSPNQFLSASPPSKALVGVELFRLTKPVIDIAVFRSDSATLTDSTRSFIAIRKFFSLDTAHAFRGLLHISWLRQD